MWARGSDEAPSGRPPRAAERRGGDPRAGHAALPRRLARLLQEHASRRGRARAVRDVRRGRRQGASGRRRRDRRQRAEPEHVLDAAVRPGRPRRRGARVRGPARPHVRHDQGGRASRPGDRRRRLSARGGQPERLQAHPLPDRLHPRPREGLPRERPPPADHGRLRHPPVHGRALDLAAGGSSGHGRDHVRRLPEARDAPGRGLPRDPSARAARSRSTTASSASRPSSPTGSSMRTSKEAPSTPSGA